MCIKKTKNNNSSSVQRGSRVSAGTQRILGAGTSARPTRRPPGAPTGNYEHATVDGDVTGGEGGCGLLTDCGGGVSSSWSGTFDLLHSCEADDWSVSSSRKLGLFRKSATGSSDVKAERGNQVGGAKTGWAGLQTVT